MVQYFVNQERRQVVCVLNDKKYTGRSFKGVAKCSPEDKFDEEFGRKLAFLRARKKEIAANISVMADRYDEEVEASNSHAAKAIKVRDNAIKLMHESKNVEFMLNTTLNSTSAH